MPKHLTSEIIRTGIAEHPTIKAWRLLQPGRIEPRGIEILQEKTKSAVYRLVGAGLEGSAVIAKQCRYPGALIERTIYETVLPHLPLSRLHYYGFVQSDDEYDWLFFEDAGGKAYSPRIEEHRLLAARWLGIMHTSAMHVAAASRLPDRGPNYYLVRLQSAYAMLQRTLADFTLTTDDRRILESIVLQCNLLKVHWSQVEQTCEAIPRTVVHGDFVGKNLRVRLSPSGIVLLPFDWETAGWGLPIADLARFADGSQTSAMSPEISIYGLIVGQFWPQFRIRDIRVLAHLGVIFRLIEAVNWTCEGLAHNRLDKRLEKFLGQLRSYQDWLASAIQVVKWGN